MNKFKIGEKVKIRTDLEINKDYGNLTFVESMSHFKEKILTIKSISKDNNTNEIAYTFEEDGLKFYFSEEMIEDKPLKPLEKENFCETLFSINPVYSSTGKIEALKIRDNAEEIYVVLNEALFLKYYIERAIKYNEQKIQAFSINSKIIIKTNDFFLEEAEGVIISIQPQREYPLTVKLNTGREIYVTYNEVELI